METLYNHAGIHQAAADIQALGAMLISLDEEIASQAATLAGSWTGEAADRAQVRFKQLQASQKEEADIVRRYSEKVSQASVSQMTTDMQGMAAL